MCEFDYGERYVVYSVGGCVGGRGHKGQAQDQPVPKIMMLKDFIEVL